MTGNEKIDWDSIFWAASKENKDEEVRKMAKEILTKLLDTLCYMEQMQLMASKKGKK